MSHKNSECIILAISTLRQTFGDRVLIWKTWLMVWGQLLKICSQMKENSYMRCTFQTPHSLFLLLWHKDQSPPRKTSLNLLKRLSRHMASPAPAFTSQLFSWKQRHKQLPVYEWTWDEFFWAKSAAVGSPLNHLIFTLPPKLIELRKNQYS